MADNAPNPPDHIRPGEANAPRSSFFGRRSALKSPNEALRPEAAPVPPPRAKKRKGSLLGAISAFFTFLVVLAFGAVAGIVVVTQKLKAAGPLKVDTVVVIPARTDVPDILDRLETEGVIDSPALMNVALVAQGSRSKLKAGEYAFKQSASLQDVIDTLVSGHSVLHSFTIPEGWTSDQVITRLREQDLLDNDVREVPKEGTLMPDTYKFARGETRDKQLQKMADAQKKVLADVWSRRSKDLPLKSPFELVTLASIVERETGRADERPRVAAVFVNRINRNMPLQSDPTIVYGLNGGKGSLGHAITREELTRPNPYNTYQIRGLPPGPIGNPGRAAMEAVANPSVTQELYFVADGTGGHAFATTLDEHNRNVLRWRQIEKDAKDRLAPDAEQGVGPIKPPDKKGAIEFTPGLALPDPNAFADNRRNAGPAATAMSRLAAALDATYTAKPGTDSKPGTDGKSGSKLSASPFSNVPVADLSMFEDPSPADDGMSALTGDPLRNGRSTDLSPSPLDGADRTALLPSGTGAQMARARAFDASEGTKLDPLKNRTFDLTSAKTVPNLR